MTAPAPRDELADLRRRAYAPGGAPADGDLARLQELEDALRAPDPASPVVAEETATTADAGRGHQPDPAPARPVAAPPREPVRRTVRRRPVLVALLAAALVGAVIAATWLLTRPEGGVILRRVAMNDTAAQQQLAGSLRNYGLDPDSYVQFESFEGLTLWTARIPDRGLRCLMLVDQQAVNTTYNGLLDYSCTPEGLLPSVDVVQFEVGGELGDRPVGSVARFVFRGDRVEVTVADARNEPVIPTPAPR